MPIVTVYHTCECSGRAFRVNCDVTGKAYKNHAFDNPRFAIEDWRIDDIVLRSDCTTEPNLEELAEIEATVDLDMIEEGDWEDE